jgi:diguanylate cyclase (GGDEF)-like protein
MTTHGALLDVLGCRALPDLEALASVALVLEPGLPCPTVERILGELGDLTSVVVRDGDRVGVLSRRDFDLVMGGRFGYGRSLNHRRPVRELATWDVPVLPPGSDVAAAAAAAVTRAEEHRFDDLLLRGRDGVLRVLTAAAVLEALAADYVRRATHDALTGLAGRDLLVERLAEVLARCGEQDAVAVTYLDVIGLKPVNRIFGHDAGDGVLVRFAEALRSCASGHDVLARVGGDEFAALSVLPGAGSAPVAAASARAEELAAAVGEVRGPDEARVRCCAGTAVARPGQQGIDAGTLLRQAAQAMYTAQRWGSGSVEVAEVGPPAPPPASS